MLYSYKSQYPTELPFRIRLSDGSTRTDPTTFTPEDILDAGYIEVQDPPAINEYQSLSWDGIQWIVRDWNQQEIDDYNLKQKNNLINYFVSETQKRLDNFAKTRNYDGILSACTYASDTNVKFSTEGQYCVEARSSTWSTLYQILNEVEAGTRPIPTLFSDIENDLPVLQWPN